MHIQNIDHLALAVLVEVSSITLEIFASRVTAKLLIKVQAVATLSDSFPIIFTVTVVKWKSKVSDSICLKSESFLFHLLTCPQRKSPTVSEPLVLIKFLSQESSLMLFVL